jgi:hypothetical protein
VTGHERRGRTVGCGPPREAGAVERRLGESGAVVYVLEGVDSQLVDRLLE